MAVAHRGGMAEATANSMEAFANTIALGYRYIETDVRATIDGKLYAWHGPPDRKRDESPLDLQSLPVKERKTLPLLVDALRTFPDTNFQIDPKHWYAVEPLADVIIKTKAMDRVCVGSFSDERTQAVAKLIFARTGKHLCTTMGPRAIKRLFIYSLLPSIVKPRVASPVVMPPYQYVTKRFVRGAHAIDVKVVPWTVNERKDMIHLLGLEVDGLITDFPSRLKEVLQERGQWSEP
jgi:glycerophosphoryl diester phosphodiesterase